MIASRALNQVNLMVGNLTKTELFGFLNGHYGVLNSRGHQRQVYFQFEALPCAACQHGAHVKTKIDITCNVQIRGTRGILRHLRALVRQATLRVRSQFRWEIAPQSKRVQKTVMNLSFSDSRMRDHGQLTCDLF